MSLPFQPNLTENDQRYSFIPNEVMDGLLPFRFNACQWKIILLLLMKKFDDEEEDEVSLPFIIQRIDRQEITIRRHLRKLAARKILIEIPSSLPQGVTQYAFNIHVEDWEVK